MDVCMNERVADLEMRMDATVEAFVAIAERLDAIEAKQWQPEEVRREGRRPLGREAV